jgi:protease-4
MWGNPIKRIEIYPPESDWKNLASRQAEEGKVKLYQDDILSPWAIHFQNLMKSNRKKLDLTVDGILNGRTFYAYDAVTNGLIDGIKPMDEILQYAFDYSTRKKFETL